MSQFVRDRDTSLISFIANVGGELELFLLHDLLPLYSVPQPVIVSKKYVFFWGGGVGAFSPILGEYRPSES